ncbi:MAG: sialidase family protein [Bryobacteraceae bacterium]|jgi:hypothetical protein
MNRRVFLECGIAAFSSKAKAATTPDRGVKNVTVYRRRGRYGGWPANHGIWSWDNEILVGFEAGYFLPSHAIDREKPYAVDHAIDREKPEEHLLARSLDGGETWSIEKPESLKAPPGTKMCGTPVESGGKVPEPCPGGIEFTRPGFALTARMEDVNIGPSRFYYSYDRGKHWNGPFSLPDFGQKGIMARTDYLVNGTHDCMLFLAASKSDGREGRPLCVRTTDGGKTWDFVSFIGPEPPDYAIMPSTVRLPDGAIITAIRRREWIEIWRSDDGARSWQFLTKAAETGGNPPSMIHLRDGRLTLTYGYRLKPFGIRAKFSSDAGGTWGEAVILRQDGGTWDLGYPRTVQRSDGKLVTVYYFADSLDSERYIAATIWDPGR